MTRRWESYGPWLIAGAALIASTLYRFLSDIRLEDALITYRYAINLARGAGFVYNEGERVLGTSTPLMTLLLAAAVKLFGAAHVGLLANLLTIPAGAAAGLVSQAALRRYGVGAGASLLAQGLLAFHPLMLWTSAGGMETPLVLLWMALGLYALAVDGPWLGAAASGLLLLTRADGAIWALLLAAAFAVRLPWRRWIGPTLLGFGIVLPWLVFASIYFGRLVPHAIVAKRTIVFAPGARQGLGDVGFWAWYLEGIWLPFAPRAPNYLDLFLSLLWLGLAVLGAWSVARDPRKRPLLLLAAFAVAYVVLFAWGRAPHAFDWYLAPLLWSSLLLGAVGLGEWFRRRPVFLVSLAALALLFGLARAERDEFRRQSDNQTNETGLRQKVGLWLRDHSSRDSTVAMEAIGYQGFYSERRVIDLAGLVTPEAVRIRRAARSNGEAFIRLLQELEPDYLVLRTYEVQNNQHSYGGRLFETPEDRSYFEAHYREVERGRAPLPQAAYWRRVAPLSIYARD